ncbi:MAG: HAD family hydrolase [Methylococcaceae bacterium]
MKTPIEVILFDLGGVLIELGESPVPATCLPENMIFNLSDWFLSETAVSFEKGLISAQVFSETLIKDLKLNASPEQITEHFTQWVIGFFPGSEELLQSLHPKYRLAVLSNSNELHWPKIIDEFKVPRYFEKIFASHLLNQAKPDLSIFQHVVTELKVNPHSILFLDDNLKNIQASKQLGIQAIHVKGIQQVRQELVNLRILDA